MDNNTENPIREDAVDRDKEDVAVVDASVASQIEKESKLGKFIGGIKTKFSSAKDWAAGEIADKKLKFAISKAFEAEAQCFLFSDQKKRVFALRNIEKKCIYIRLGEKFLAGDELSASGQTLIITEFDNTHCVPCSIANGKYEVNCIQVFYNLKTQEKVNMVTNNFTNTCNITGDNNQASLINFTDTLDQIESIIKNAKVNIFNKTKKTEALSMFAQYKDCIIKNVAPTKTFKDRFIEVLRIVAESAVPLILGLAL